MNEATILSHISNIVTGTVTFPQAIQQIAILLEREADGKGIFIEQSAAAKLLESFDQPYRSLYSVDLLDGGEVLGKITLCFAADHFAAPLHKRLAEFVGQQLGMLLMHTFLSERRAQLRSEIAAIEEDLASRKLMQRAEGLLIARGLAPAVARRWIAQQSHKTGLSQNDIADRIIAYDQATGLLERRIA